MQGCRRLFRWINNHIETATIRNITKELEKKENDYKIEESYCSEYQENIDYSNYQTEIKTITFYLPQFHTFPENDAWWGKGFTEWTNTRKALPRFEGHYQPRIPHRDIGYYDLSQEKAIERQIKLAKQHKIYGFCFYYYWFSGKRLMEKPLDIFLRHPEWDIKFCLCWANENFTRTWTGSADNILIEQKYEDEDPEKFITSLKKYIEDDRYIRVNGKPVIIIYNMGAIPKVRETIHKWRNSARQEGIGEIEIWMCQTNATNARLLHLMNEIDAEVEFPPHNMWWKPIHENVQREDNEKIYNYRKLVDIMVYRIQNSKKERKKPLYHTCMLGWDNSCRRENGWTLYHGFTISKFKEWVDALVEDVRKNQAEDKRYIFVNAWNEWGEGTYLEPDEKYGYTNINVLSQCICKKQEQRR